MEKIQNKKGNALIWTVMFMALFFLIASTVAVITLADIRQATNIDSSTEAYLVAEAGIERARNYVLADQSTIGSGYIDSNTYKFEVVKAVVGSQSPFLTDQNRICDNTTGSTDKYCYYSQAVVGNVKRKIIGEHNNIPLSQGQSTNFDSSLILNNDIGIPSIDFQNLGSSYQTFTYVTNLADNDSGNSYNFGLASSSTNGVDIVVGPDPNNTGKLEFYLADMHYSHLGSNMINNITAGSLQVTLVYRKSGIATLKLQSDTSCLGIISASVAPNLNPYDAFFVQGTYNASFPYAIWLNGKQDMQFNTAFLRVE